MAAELVEVCARQSEWLPICHLEMTPSIAGREWRFEFENNDVGIALPEMPPPNQRIADERATAHVHRWKADTGEVLAAAVYAIKVTVHSLRMSISCGAAQYPGHHQGLHSEEKARELDTVTSHYFRLARRAVQHWLRVARWKLNAPLLDLDLAGGSRVLRGASLINEATGERFWTSPEGRTAVAPGYYCLTDPSWSSIEHALRNHFEPPVWEEYRASARRRVEEDDLVAATIDMAVAAEAAIRYALDQSLPSATPIGVRNELRRLNMKDLLGKWADFGLPDQDGPRPFDLGQIQFLMDTRNTIMHRGTSASVTRKWCRDRADDLDQLVGAICT